ncbi:MAG: hypothetical protein Q8904_01895 [Bacteroidota bacterium]|nr:hypothetical protein [Bacteroidota bacterium]
MKKTTFKSLFVTLSLLFIASQSFAQNLTGTRIDVRGSSSQLGDQMWIFSVASCTYGFDNGWDGFKMLGSSLAPQLFAIEPDGNYQVDAVPDANNTYLGFSAGVDSVYTFTFNNENLDLRYQQLYLIDSIANKTIDIYQTGSTYTFSALRTPQPVKRFKIVTSLPQVVVPTTPKDTVPVVTPPVTPVDSAVTNPTVPPTILVDSVNNKNKTKQIKIFSSRKQIHIVNPGKQKGTLTISSAASGIVQLKVNFSAASTKIIDTNLSTGTYIASVVTAAEKVSTIILIP